MGDAMGYDPDLDKPDVQEELANIRLNAERGRSIAGDHFDTKLADVFQNILDILERIKT